jgi:hypothetical protein
VIRAALAAGLFALAPASAPTVAFTVHAPAVIEASGIARGIVAPNVFYVQNDSGDSARFFSIDARTGRLVTTFHVPGATNHDWEDLAVARAADGTPSVWLADIGDNDATRREVQLYRVPEVATTRRVVRTARPAVWRLRYPSGPVNAESLFVDPRGRAYLVTKTTSGHSDVYAVPLRPNARRVQQLRKVGRIALKGSHTFLGGAEVETTGAAMSADGTLLVVRTYVAAYLWHVRDDDVAAALRTRPKIVGVPLQRQGEGVCLSGDAMYLDSEGRNQPVWRVPLPAQFRDPAASTKPTPGARPSPSAASGAAATTTSGTSVPVLGIAGGVLLIVAVLVVFGVYRRRGRG